MASSSKAEKKDERSSKREFKSICVFGEPNFEKNAEYLQAASELGKALAARKISLVYGGGIQGLRGCAATSASIGGSRVLGVLVREFPEKNTPYHTVGNEYRVSSLPERMGYMLYSSEAFIALPGGLETLDGISSIAYWAKLNYHHKPLGLLNMKGFYDGLIAFLNRAVEQGFIPQATRRAIMYAPTADELIDQLQSYVPEPDPPKIQVDPQPSNSPERSDSSKKSKLDPQPSDSPDRSDSSKKPKLDTTLRL